MNTASRHLAIALTLMAAAWALGATRCPGDELRYPIALAVNDSGTIFVADSRLPGIWKLEEGRLKVFYRGSTRYRTPLNAVRCVAIDRDGRLLAGDAATRNVYRFDASGQPQPLTRLQPVDSADDAAPAPLGRIGLPVGIAVNGSGEIFVSDLEVGRVVKLGPDGGDPAEVARIAGCRGLFVDRQDRLWVVSTAADQLHRIAADGDREVVVRGRPFEFPHTVVADEQGNAYVCDGYARAIWKVTSGGQVDKWVEDDALVNPVGMAMHGDSVYVADPRAAAVFEISSAGQLTKLELGSDGP